MNLEKYKKVLGEDFTKDAEFIDSQIKAMNLNENSKILDVGTGWGTMAILLALNGLHVLTGQPEYDPEWEEHKDDEHGHLCEHEHNHDFPNSDWRENAMSVGVEDLIDFQNLDAHNLDFSDNSFDGVFLYDALQHMMDRERALNECIRVSSSTGIVCVIEWNQKTIDTEKKEFGYEIDYVDPRDILNRNDISIKHKKGEYVNIFLLKKT